MCGEHRSGFNALFFLTGSSPHVRGALDSGVNQVERTGIIPACAGSTAEWVETARRCGDHPRMCGEHIRPSSRPLP